MRHLLQIKLSFSATQIFTMIYHLKTLKFLDAQFVIYIMTYLAGNLDLQSCNKN